MTHTRLHVLKGLTIFGYEGAKASHVLFADVLITIVREYFFIYACFSTAADIILYAVMGKLC